MRDSPITEEGQPSSARAKPDVRGWCSGTAPAVRVQARAKPDAQRCYQELFANLQRCGTAGRER
jgi:hypothetical protein